VTGSVQHPTAELWSNRLVRPELGRDTGHWQSQSHGWWRARPCTPGAAVGDILPHSAACSPVCATVRERGTRAETGVSARVPCAGSAARAGNRAASHRPATSRATRAAVGRRRHERRAEVRRRRVNPAARLPGKGRGGGTGRGGKLWALCRPREGAVGLAFEGGDGLLVVGQIQVLQRLPSVTARRVGTGPSSPAASKCHCPTRRGRSRRSTASGRGAGGVEYLEID
jgi:hypothetical protein